MAGELVPLVMVPRYTTYAGNVTGYTANPGFTTVGMDVSEYDSAIINFWRGPIVVETGTPTFLVTCQESTDQNVWSTCAGTTADTAVSENAELQFTPTLSKRWFRIKIMVAGTKPVVSCWAVGYLIRRLR